MLDGYKDMGAVVACGKIEQGKVLPGTKAVVMPLGTKVIIKTVQVDEDDLTHANVGENVKLIVSGCSEDDLKRGYVLCPQVNPGRAVTKFKAQLQILELLEERPIISAGYGAVIHVH